MPSTLWALSSDWLISFAPIRLTSFRWLCVTHAYFFSAIRILDFPGFAPAKHQFTQTRSPKDIIIASNSIWTNELMELDLVEWSWVKRCNLKNPIMWRAWDIFEQYRLYIFLIHWIEFEGLKNVANMYKQTWMTNSVRISKSPETIFERVFHFFLSKKIYSEKAELLTED